ncbi:MULTISPECIES: flagellar motor stator protein MotA [unclassified Pseudomonas]|uniref:flagellar motor stator protein MotA n=1 Tax=unclassified Pseudomonas TaxID=196821 RepID=UPI0009DA81BA|nr:MULTISPECIES: flagellar motor stator protein MotA [unclassified Pseudomonas]MDF3864995.1 flagellar motor stator protein MotA [Pseudomonas denitrificans (nom. rej.)]OQR31950.1 flagellar motor stator protein MotA [Pseudomonas sp. T]MBD9514730.1 flagellar motor stator protein MotA [Pseudomonas sp. PDM22]MBD9634073.1 flagellar motor stator protein MotA [Pseudomonas sp. PDM19]MBD9677614.1 flagellar motor stator protein MotA [Pseudomonas sp. PDM18]
MQKIIGALIIIAAVLGGYAMAHGDMRALWQPAEMLIILGAGLGTLVVANPREVLLEMCSQIKGVFVFKRRGEEFQRQLLMLLYELLEMVDVGGLKVLDAHIEEPDQSDLFARYPLILQEKNLMAFIADNFRLMAMGKISAHELEGFLEQELDAMEHALLQPSKSLHKVGEAMPGFGILAAILGIIITMGNIGGSVAEIGAHVAAALVGTFFGIFVCYCLMDPLSNAMSQRVKTELSALECVRTTLVAHVAGKPTLLAVDAGRKLIEQDVKPAFKQLETWVTRYEEERDAA